MLTQYYKTMLERLNKMDPGHEAEYESALLGLQDNFEEPESTDPLKPIKRPKGSQALSKYIIDGVTSVKVGGRPLGSGVYARTYHHVDGLTDEDGKLHDYAVKVFRFPPGTVADPLPEQVRREIAALKREGRYLRHGVRENEKGELKIYLVENFIPGPTLARALEEVSAPQLLSMDQSLNLMLQLATCMQKFYKKNYAHGDLRVNNIMVDDIFAKQPTCILLDFNDTTAHENEIIHFDRKLSEGQYTHIPPECCNTKQVHYTPKSDLYALGFVFQQILDKTAFCPKILTKTEDLIQLMRARDPKSRPDFNGLIDSLRALREELKVTVSPKPIEKKIEANAKKELIAALSEYTGGLRAFRALAKPFIYYLGDSFRNQYIDDKDYLEKSETMSALIEKIQKNQSQAEIYTLLRTALRDYIQKYVAHDLEHYCELSDLGASLGCLIKAIKICDKSFDPQELRTEVAHAIPRFKSEHTRKHWNERKSFVMKLSHELHKSLDLNGKETWTVKL